MEIFLFLIIGKLFMGKTIGYNYCHCERHGLHFRYEFWHTLHLTAFGRPAYPVGRADRNALAGEHGHGLQIRASREQAEFLQKGHKKTRQMAGL